MPCSSWIATLALLTYACAATAGTIDASAYDHHLCQTAQRLIINADADFPVIEQRGSGNGFHTIQMSVDEDHGAAVIAMTTHYAEYSGARQATVIACKMVDRDRVNDSLQLQLPGPDIPCRAVNETTLARALTELTAEERTRYLNDGRQLLFADDAIVATGGEWLPVTMDTFINVDAANNVTVRAPSVRVPWNLAERNFYQGTQHCKLISLAAIRRWVTQAAFAPDATLVPPTDTACTTPHSISSDVGSCLFYFAPADSMFCQDYSGYEWQLDSARQECNARHASREALAAAANRYEGTGGEFSTGACADRDDVPPISGTCVFHCRAGDETLWHISGTVDPRMTRGCDLFIERD
jgi:hypothetical protein